MTRATVSIVSHGHGQMIDNLLRDLARQTAASEIAVVLTQNIAEADPQAECSGGLSLDIRRNARPKGFGTNHNTALAGCRSDWVLIVNPDIRIPDATAIERLLKVHDGRAGVIAPMVRNGSGQREDSVRVNLDPLSLLQRRLGSRRTKAHSTDDRQFRWVAGMFLVLPLDVWRLVGGFDERFFLYCEDYDLCARVALSGRSIVVDESVTVIHDAQRASHRSWRFLRWHITSLVKVWASSAFWRVWLSDLGLLRKRR